MSTIQTNTNINFRKNILASSAMVAAALLSAHTAKAAPTVGQVVKGDATIQVNGDATNINQISNRAAIDWQSFSVAAHESVNFNVPNNGATLNRVVGNTSSLIQGSITSNGTLYLVNPNGLVFDVGSRVNAQNFIASTGNIDPDQFMNGDRNINLGTSSANARISLKGTITAADRGVVGIFAPRIENQGYITANLGSVVLAGAQSSVIDFTGDGLMTFEMGATTDRTSENEYLGVANSGTINAAGGHITLTTRGAEDLFNAMVINSGNLIATSLTAKGGTVTVKAIDGDLNESGKIDASGTGGGGDVMVWAKGIADYTGNIKSEALAGDTPSNGGAVEVSGIQNLRFNGIVSTMSYNGGRVGSLLLDPTDLWIVATTGSGASQGGVTVVSSGGGASNLVTLPSATNVGNVSTRATLGGDTHNVTDVSAIQSALQTNNLILDATAAGAGGGTGKIRVLNDIRWNTGTSLTLKAGGGGIVIAAKIDASAQTPGRLFPASPTTGDVILESGGKIEQVANTYNTSSGATNKTYATVGGIVANNLTIIAAGEVTLNGATMTAAAGSIYGGTLGTNISATQAGALVDSVVPAGSTQAITGVNKINNLKGFTQNGTGSTNAFSLTNTQALTVTGAVNNSQDGTAANTSAVTLITAPSAGAAAGAVALQINAAVTGSTVTLTAQNAGLAMGSVTNAAGAEVSTGAVNASSLSIDATGGAITVSGAIDALTALNNDNTKAFSLVSSKALTVTPSLLTGEGDVTLSGAGLILKEDIASTGGTVTLASTGGAIRQEAGKKVYAVNLNLTAKGAVTLIGTVTNLTGLTQNATTGTAVENAVSFTNDQALTITGAVNNGTNNLSLITTAGGLELKAAVTGAAVTLTSAAGLTLGSITNPDTMAVVSTGAVNASTGLSLTATGANNVTGAIAALTSLTDTTLNAPATGAFNLTSTRALSIDTAINTGANAINIKGAGITLTKDVTTTGTLTLESTGGAIVGSTSATGAAGTGLVSAGSLAVTAKGAVTLQGGFGTLSSFTQNATTGTGTTNAVSITSSQALTIGTAVSNMAGAANANDVTLKTTTGALTLNAAVTAATLTLDSAGTIGGNASGLVTATNLAVTANGTATLSGAVGTLNSFTQKATGTGNVFSLTSTQALTLGGAVNNSKDGTAANTSAITLSSSGSITGADGSITTSSLSLTATGEVKVSGAITALTSLTHNTPGAFSLISTAALTVNAAITTGANAITIKGAGITLAKDITTTGTLTLESTGTGGAITGSTGAVGSGLVKAVNLAVTAKGGVTLKGEVDNLTSLTQNATGTGNAFSLNSTKALTVTGLVNNKQGNDASNVTLKTTGALVLTAATAAVTGATVTLESAGSISNGSGGAGTVNASGLAVTASGAVTLTGAVSALNSLSQNATGGDNVFSLTSSTALTISGAVNNKKNTDVSNVILKTTSGAVTLNGTGTVTGRTVTLNSASSIGGTGSVNASSLEVTASGTVTLNGAIGTLTSFTQNATGAANAFSLTSSQALTVSGSVRNSTIASPDATNSSDVTLKTTSGALTLSQDVVGKVVTLTSAAGLTINDGVGGKSSVVLNSGGDITGGDGAIDTASLTITANGEVTVNGAIDAIAGFTQNASGTSNAFALTSTKALTVTGAVNNKKDSDASNVTLKTTGGAVTLNAAVTGAAVTLDATGSIGGNGTGGAGTVNATNLSLTASGAVTLTGAIGGISAFTQNATGTTGHLAITSTSALKISGNVVNGTLAVNVLTGRGNINLSSSEVITLDGTASLKATNVTLRGKSLNLQGGITSTSATDLTATGGEVDGNLAAIKATSLTATVTNAATLADNLGAYRGNGSLNLGNTANEIAALGAITASAITINNNVALTLNGNLTTSSTNNGTATLGGGEISVTTGSHNLTIGGVITTNAASALFDLGGVGRGTFTVDGSNKISSTNNQPMAILAGGFSFAGATGKGIDVGTGSLSTSSSGGTKNDSGNITITNEYLQVNHLTGSIGTAFTDAQKDNNVTAGSYGGVGQAVVIKTTGQINVGAVTYLGNTLLTLITDGSAGFGGSSSAIKFTAASSFAGGLALEATGGDITQEAGGTLITPRLIITAKNAPVSADILIRKNPDIASANVNLGNAGNMIERLGAITANNITINNGKELILTGNLTTSGLQLTRAGVSNGGVWVPGQVDNVVGTGKIAIITSNASNISLGADVQLNGTTNSLDMGAAGGNFVNNGFTISTTNNQNLEIMAKGFTLNAPTNAAKRFAIDVGDGLVLTFDPGKTRDYTGSFIGDGNFTGATGFMSGANLATDGAGALGPNNPFNFGAQRTGGSITSTALALVNQASDAQAASARFRSNVVNITPVSATNGTVYFDKFTLGALGQDLTINVKGNVVFLKNASNSSSVSGANLTLNAVGSKMTLNQGLTVTGGAMTLNAANGLTINGAALAATNADATKKGEINLNGGSGAVKITSPSGDDYTFTNANVNVTGALFVINLDQTEGVGTKKGKLLGGSGDTKSTIDSSALTTAFSGASSGNVITFANGSQAVIFVTNETTSADNKVTINSASTFTAAPAGTGITLATGTSLSLGVNYGPNAVVTIDDTDRPAKGKDAGEKGFENNAAKLAWIQGGTIYVTGKPAIFKGALVLQSDNVATKMVAGKAATVVNRKPVPGTPDEYANIYIAGSLTTGGALTLTVTNNDAAGVAPALTTGVTAANNYGIIAKGTLTAGGSVYVNANGNVMAAGTGQAAAVMINGTINAAGNVRITSNGDSVSSVFGSATGIQLGTITAGGNINVANNADVTSNASGFGANAVMAAGIVINQGANITAATADANNNNMGIIFTNNGNVNANSVIFTPSAQAYGIYNAPNILGKKPVISRITAAAGGILMDNAGSVMTGAGNGVNNYLAHGIELGADMTANGRHDINIVQTGAVRAGGAGEMVGIMINGTITATRNVKIAQNASTSGGGVSNIGIALAANITAGGDIAIVNGSAGQSQNVTLFASLSRVVATNYGIATTNNRVTLLSGGLVTLDNQVNLTSGTANGSVIPTLASVRGIEFSGVITSRNGGDIRISQNGTLKNNANGDAVGINLANATLNSAGNIAITNGATVSSHIGSVAGVMTGGMNATSGMSSISVTNNADLTGNLYGAAMTSITAYGVAATKGANTNGAFTLINNGKVSLSGLVGLATGSVMAAGVEIMRGAAVTAATANIENRGEVSTLNQYANGTGGYNTKTPGYNTTVTAIGVDINASVTSLGDMIINQTGAINNSGSGSVAGVVINDKLSSAGSIRATQNSNIQTATGNKATGFKLNNATVTAYNDVAFTQSGMIRVGSFANNVFTAAADSQTGVSAINVTSASTLSGSAAGYSWVTLRGNNLNLQLDGGLTVNKAEVRLDLNSNGQIIAGTSKITAGNLNLYYTGKETASLSAPTTAKVREKVGNVYKMVDKVTNYTIAVDLKTASGSGNFYLVQNVDELADKKPNLTAAATQPGWVNASNQYIGYSSRNAVTVTGDGNKAFSYVEGATITVSGATFTNGVKFNSIGGAGASGGFNLNGNLTSNGAVSIFTHGGNFAMGGAAVIASSTTARASGAADTAPILVNLGGNNNGGSFSNGGFTLTTSNHDLTVLAGAWNLTGSGVVIELGGATGGNFSEGGMTLTGNQTISANTLYQGGADVLATQGALISAKLKINNDITTTGNITISGVNGLNLGTAKIIASAGSITVNGNSTFYSNGSGNTLFLDSQGAGTGTSAPGIMINAALTLVNGTLNLKTSGAITEAYSVTVTKNGRKTTTNYAGSIAANTLVIDAVGGKLELSGNNAISTISSITQKAATVSGTTTTPNTIAINNLTALTVGTINRTDAAGANVTTVAAATPASDVKITTVGAYSDLTLNAAIANVANLTLNAGGNLKVLTNLTSNGAMSLVAGNDITSDFNLEAKNTAASGNNNNISVNSTSGTVNLTGMVTANMVSSSAGGSVIINDTSNLIANFGVISAGGNLDIGSAGSSAASADFNLTGSLKAGASATIFKVSNYKAGGNITVLLPKPGIATHKSTTVGDGAGNSAAGLSVNGKGLEFSFKDTATKGKVNSSSFTYSYKVGNSTKSWTGTTYLNYNGKQVLLTSSIAADNTYGITISLN